MEWNRLLLDTYVPHAWAELLPVLLTSDHLQDAFALWPPFQPIVQGGDTTYWSCIPLHFLRVIISLKLRIWPVFDASGDFSNLESILVASATDQVKTLHALKAAAVNITLPPKYVKDLLDDSNIEYTSLSPNAAYGSMLVSFPPHASCCFSHVRFLDRSPPCHSFTIISSSPRHRPGISSIKQGPHEYHWPSLDQAGHGRICIPFTIQCFSRQTAHALAMCRLRSIPKVRRTGNSSPSTTSLSCQSSSGKWSSYTECCALDTRASCRIYSIVDEWLWPGYGCKHPVGSLSAGSLLVKRSMGMAREMARPRFII